MMKRAIVVLAAALAIAGATAATARPGIDDLADRIADLRADMVKLCIQTYGTEHPAVVEGKPIDPRYGACVNLFG